MSENLFRIGGVYRDNTGDVVRLTRLVEDGKANGELLHLGGIWRPYPAGFDLQTGKWRESRRDGECMNLLPGELHNVNGEWLPIEDSELLALQTRPQHEPASCEEDPVGWFKAATARIASKRPADPTAEPKRPPLAYFSEAKRFDAWKGFSVTSDCAVESQPDGCFRGLRLDGCGSYRVPKVL